MLVVGHDCALKSGTIVSKSNEEKNLRQGESGYEAAVCRNKF